MNDAQEALAAAEKIGDAILSACPRWLILVQGVGDVALDGETAAAPGQSELEHDGHQTERELLDVGRDAFVRVVQALQLIADVTAAAMLLLPLLPCRPPDPPHDVALAERAAASEYAEYDGHFRFV